MQRAHRSVPAPRLAGRRAPVQPAAAVLPLAGARSPRSAPSIVRRLGLERRTRLRLAATDLAVVVATTLIVGLLEPGARAPEIPTPPLMPVLAAPVLTATVVLLLLAAFRSREPGILTSGATEYRRVAHAALLAFGVLAIPALAFEWHDLRLQLLAALPAALVAVLVGRWQWRRWLIGRRREGEWASRTVVVGDRAEVAYVLARLARAGELGYHVLGAVVRDGGNEPFAHDGRRVPVLGDVQQLAEIAQRIGADAVILAGDADGDARGLAELSRRLEGCCAELVLYSRLAEVAGPRISFRPVDGLPLVQVRIPTFDGGRHVLKRALDIGVASLALLPIALLAIPIAIAIRLDSPGPVLFSQQRVGRDGQLFSMLKFRTMRVDAEAQLAALLAQNEADGPMFKLREDPRVTRVGRFLRRTSLDELPQFWNALRGDMSVVGPRPPLPAEATSYDGTVARRLYLKPGITGLWQVSGRSDLSWEESVRLDLRYVENWSVMEDVMIIWRTAKVMVRPRGAY